MSGIFGGVLLAIELGVVVLFSRALMHVAGERRLPVALAFAVMLFAAAPITLCRLTEDLVAATSLTALLAALGTASLWRWPPVAHPAEGAPARPSRGSLALAGILFTLVAVAAIRNHLWDEYSGHFPLAASIARGVSPPEHPLFPGEPFRYHYAYDVLAGIVRAFTGLEVAAALDVVTIGSFLLLLATSASMGAHLAGSRGASIAMLAAPLGSGTLQYLLLPELGTFEVRWSALPERWLQSVPPPVISNFFQHPQGLAMPVALAVLLLFDGTDRSPRGRRGRAILGAVLLGLMSLAQLVFFLVVGLALGVAVLARALREREARPAARELGLLAGALGLAYLLGGFFERSSATSPAGLLVFGRSYFGEPAGSALLHHLVLFGLPLVLLPVGVLRAVQEGRVPRIALAAGAIVGFAIPSFVTYARSWDIVKFYGVGGFFANLLFAEVLAAWGPWRTRRGLAAGLLAAATFVGWFWVARMSILDGALGIPKMHFGPPPPIADAVFDALGPRVGPRQRVFSTNMDMAMGAGFLTPGFDWRAHGDSFMLDRARADVATRHYQAARHHLRREDLEALDVDFVVLSPGDLAGLTPEARASLEDPTRFEHLFEVTVPGDSRQVYRVVR